MCCEAPYYFFQALQPILQDRENVCIIVLTQFLMMYLLTQLTSVALPFASPRVSTLPRRRQQQIYVAILVIILKAIITYLISDYLLHDYYNHIYPSNVATIAGPTVWYRFQILFFIATSYVFELLYRPSSPSLILHHVALQAPPYYYVFYLKYTPQVDLVLQFFSIMVLLGPGLTDIATDITFVVYYSAARTRSGEIGLLGLSWAASIARTIQWIALFSFIGVNWARFVRMLNVWEKGVFGIAIVFWIWTEVDEILKVRGMVRKFSLGMEGTMKDASLVQV